MIAQKEMKRRVRRLEEAAEKMGLTWWREATPRERARYLQEARKELGREASPAEAFAVWAGIPIEAEEEPVSRCPVCCAPTEDDRPVEVDGEIIEGGCSDCWERQLMDTVRVLVAAFPDAVSLRDLQRKRGAA